LQKKFMPTKTVTSMEEAIQIAQQIAKKWEIVLLSPASASFSGFANYEERGNAFKKAVKKLKNASKWSSQ
jgi:UDP-N-acetylmuramoylalanine--D-glutamate ligase